MCGRVCGVFGAWGFAPIVGPVVMRNLQEALRGAGAMLNDVVKTTVYVASSKQEDLVQAWRVVREYMGDHDAPSTLLGVATLGYDDQLVEVEAVAVIDDSHS